MHIESVHWYQSKAQIHSCFKNDRNKKQISAHGFTQTEIQALERQTIWSEEKTSWELEGK